MVDDLLSGSSTGEGATQGVLELPWHELANFTPYSFLVFFVLVGFLFWLRSTPAQPRTITSFAVASVVMIPLLYPSPVLLVDALAGVHFTEGRFAHYGFIFVGLTSGYGLYVLLNRGGKRAVVALLLLMACFSFVAISNDFVASDNPLVERPFYTYYLTEQEEHTFERVSDTHEGSLGADYITCHYTENLLETECRTFVVDDDHIEHAALDGVVLRTGEFEQRPIYLGHDDPYVSAERIPWEELAERNRVHDSGTVSYYR